MLHFEGDREFTQPAAELWDRLRDCRFLAGSIPGEVKISRSERDDAVFVLRPGVSFIRGSLEVSLHLAEATPHSTLRYQVHGKGIGSSNDVVVSLMLTPRADGTLIHWSAEVTALGGLMKAIPHGLIQASAQKVIQDLWEAVAGRLNAGPSASAAEPMP